MRSSSMAPLGVRANAFVSSGARQSVSGGSTRYSCRHRLTKAARSPDTSFSSGQWVDIRTGSASMTSQRSGRRFVSISRLHERPGSSGRGDNASGLGWASVRKDTLNGRAPVKKVSDTLKVSDTSSIGVAPSVLGHSEAARARKLAACRRRSIRSRSLRSRTRSHGTQQRARPATTPHPGITRRGDSSAVSAGGSSGRTAWRLSPSLEAVVGSTRTPSRLSPTRSPG